MAPTSALLPNETVEKSLGGEKYPAWVLNTLVGRAEICSEAGFPSAWGLLEDPKSLYFTNIVRECVQRMDGDGFIVHRKSVIASTTKRFFRQEIIQVCETRIKISQSRNCLLITPVMKKGLRNLQGL